MSCLVYIYDFQWYDLSLCLFSSSLIHRSRTRVGGDSVINVGQVSTINLQD